MLWFSKFILCIETVFWHNAYILKIYENYTCDIKQLHGVILFNIAYIYVYITVDREKATTENAAITKNIVGMNFRICYYKKKQTGTANSAGTRTCFFETGQVAGCFFYRHSYLNSSSDHRNEVPHHDTLRHLEY